MKVHCDHPTQHSTYGAPSFVAVLREELFRLEVRANRCQRCDRVLAAKDAGRRIYSGYDDGNGDTGARVETMTSTKPSDKRYTDSSGNECSLDTMCRREPEWAANRMRWMIDRIAELDAEVAELRASQAQVHKLVTEYSHHISPAIRETLSAKVSAVAPRSSLPDGAICTVCGCEKRDHELPLRSSSCFAFTVLPAAPRRTPELTERVAMWLKEHGQDWPIALCRADAAALLDLVFGKGHG